MFLLNFKENCKWHQLLINPTSNKYAAYKHSPGFCLKLFKQNVILDEDALFLPSYYQRTRPASQPRWVTQLHQVLISRLPCRGGEAGWPGKTLEGAFWCFRFPRFDLASREQVSGSGRQSVCALSCRNGSFPARSQDWRVSVPSPVKGAVSTWALILPQSHLFFHPVMHPHSLIIWHKIHLGSFNTSRILTRAISKLFPRVPS